MRQTINQDAVSNRNDEFERAVTIADGSDQRHGIL